MQDVMEVQKVIEVQTVLEVLGLLRVYWVREVPRLVEVNEFEQILMVRFGSVEG